MKEELEEGHFDKDGHYQWDKTKEIKDSWLDTIDWIKIKTSDADRLKDDSMDSDSFNKQFDILSKYKEIITFMNPGETVKKCIQRIGGNTAKLSSAERWKLKKAGIKDESSIIVTKLTEICNEILTETGNMNIYEEKYEYIKNFINKNLKTEKILKAETSTSKADDLDMYADDFEEKEKEKLIQPSSSTDESTDNIKSSNDEITWEFKWKEDDTEIHGPFNSQQMQLWVDEGYFKDGVLVRKTGSEDQKFYTSKRIDFDLYI